ncbi:Protein VTS1 [Leucoagaricus sp. SymC.cos]|nr:Protein VTS1 [Leucoagaricus sp. SymC.cos]
MTSPVAATLAASTVTPVSKLAPGATLEGLDHWLKDFHKYEAILAEMANASADNKFKDELATIEKWFKVLSEPERTASVHTLLQHSTQDQIRFFMAVLQQMIKPEERATDSVDSDSNKPKNSKIGLRPPSLNIPLPGFPVTPTPITTSKSQDSAVVPPGDGNRLNLPRPLSNKTPVSPLASQDGVLPTPGLDKSWASMVSTPLVPMFQKPDSTRNDVSANGATSGTGLTQSGIIGSKGPGLIAINSTTLNMLATSGLSNDAQLLAVQLIMSGIVQPADIATATTKQEQTLPPQTAGKPNRKGAPGNWRTPSSAKYPGSALRSSAPSSGLKSSGSKKSGLKSSGLDSASIESSKVEDFKPELLKDVPAWLRSLRLHKYTSCFEGMTWQDMMVLDDGMLEKKGVAALGARRRLLRTFDHVRREMGMEPANNATPTTSAVPTGPVSSSPDSTSQIVPQSAAPATKLSADSPVFMPTGRVTHSAVPVVALTPVISTTV